MIFVVNAESRKKHAADLTAMHSHRKAVFVDRAGWELPVVADQEIDRYDLMEDTLYLLAKADPQGTVLASARLLTTAGPHLMRDLYSPPSPVAIPTGPRIWEVSRYCTAPEVQGPRRRLALLWETIAGIMEAALACEIHQVIFLANRALLPLAMRCGWDAITVGPTISDGHDEITAVIATITPQGLGAVRARYGLIKPAIVPLRAGSHQTDREKV